jgi:hypothetical protein
MKMHEHHNYVDIPAHAERNAVLAYQQLSKLVTDYLLGNSGTVLPPSGWTMGLSTIAVGTHARNSVWSATISGSNINEIGSTTAAGYARQTIARSIATGSVDWIASTFDNTTSTGGQSTTSDQVTFGAFSGAPNPNGANSWVVTDGTTLNASTSAGPFFGGDTAATRTFANGDTEKVTPTLKAG